MSKYLKTPTVSAGFIFRFILLLVSLSVAGNAIAQSNRLAYWANLPRQMAWTAYNLGSTGYNQAVGIGAMLREKYGVTLRVIPGQNDVSRLLPLKLSLIHI